MKQAVERRASVHKGNSWSANTAARLSETAIEEVGALRLEVQVQ